jgi:hypothetical protein
VIPLGGAFSDSIANLKYWRTEFEAEKGVVIRRAGEMSDALRYFLLWLLASTAAIALNVLWLDWQWLWGPIGVSIAQVVIRALEFFIAHSRYRAACRKRNHIAWLLSEQASNTVNLVERLEGKI